ncbi:MAG: hypothetical protein ETSY1_43170 [Candidatus Entotheonella factor]|uniref:Uncharacterized protein n=1 Tax=Entotheonella factor TaxID=1429438 RepID=W4L364_ENTF1|nr:MAG: hypothetical protein ETSY1_43170 [Candidatus Entotheonella factor]
MVEDPRNAYRLIPFLPNKAVWVFFPLLVVLVVAVAVRLAPTPPPKPALPPVDTERYEVRAFEAARALKFEPDVVSCLRLRQTQSHLCTVRLKGSDRLLTFYCPSWRERSCTPAEMNISP